MIQLKNVSFSFDKPLFQQLTLTFSEKRIYGIVGADGSGKSTFLRLLMGVYQPKEGEIQRSDQLLYGFVSENMGLYEEMSVMENLLFFGQLYGLSKEETRKRSAELLTWVELAPFANRLVGKLSGGMKRKLAVIRAIIHQPQCLILDEPTYGIDPVARQEIWTLIEKIHRQGTMIFVSTQYLNEIAYCDEVLFFHRGKLLTQASPVELIEQFPYRVLSLGEEKRLQLSDLYQLRQMEGVLDAYFRGSELILLCQDPQVVRKACQKERSNIQENDWIEIEPSYEEVFISLMKRGGENLGD
jgi:ABC-2 type transport system ATP-binding protein